MKVTYYREETVAKDGFNVGAFAERERGGEGRPMARGHHLRGGAKNREDPRPQVRILASRA